jgi:hypothetical protein
MKLERFPRERLNLSSVPGAVENRFVRKLLRHCTISRHREHTDRRRNE